MMENFHWNKNNEKLNSVESGYGTPMMTLVLKSLESKVL